jgi:hypothetical protein
MPDSEDALQMCAHKLETIAAKYGGKMSKDKHKTVAFKGRAAVRSEIVINNNILSEQINAFSYPGCLISYQNEKILPSKYQKFSRYR